MNPETVFAIDDHAWFMAGASVCEGNVTWVTPNVPTEYGLVTMYDVRVTDSNTKYHIASTVQVPHVYMRKTKAALMEMHFMIKEPVV